MKTTNKNPFLKKLIRRYVVFGFKNFYSEFHIIGEENIPSSGPVIFAPNHTNALMDAIAIHAILPTEVSVTFLARSDIFKNKRVAGILNYLGLLPAFRIRDGVENLAKNDASFEKCVELLNANAALGIMPEGNQGDERKIRPLVKGIFRIGFAAQQKIGIESAVKIVPVGLDFGSITNFGKHIIISVGKPIEISKYISRYEQNPALATNELKAELASSLSDLTINITSSQHYNSIEMTLEIVAKMKTVRNNNEYKALEIFEIKKQTLKKLLQLEATEPEKILELEKYCTELQEDINAYHIKPEIIVDKTLTTADLIKKTTLLIVGAPLFIIGLLCNILPFKAPEYLRKKLGVKYKGFYSSFHFVFGLISFPVFYFIQICLINAAFQLTWVEFILAFGFQYLMGKIAYSWLSSIKTLKDRLYYRRFCKQYPPLSNRIQFLIEKISNIAQ